MFNDMGYRVHSSLTPHVDLMLVLNRAIEEERSHVLFMLHSSELMPGGSSTFGTADDIKNPYDNPKELFVYASERFTSTTLAEGRANCDLPV